LFHPSSGDTFLVDEVAAEGLRCLEVSALDGAGLCAVLGLRLNIEDDADLARYVDEMVTRYANLGLLEAEAP
jgi:PqqD family protein of HPr-rel-A system